MTLAGGMNDTGNEVKLNGTKRQDLMYLGIDGGEERRRKEGRGGGEGEREEREKGMEGRTQRRKHVISISNTG